MGMDIETWPMRRLGESLVEVPIDPPLFDWRNYHMFALFADEMRQYVDGPSIAKVRGLPPGMPPEYRYDCTSALCVTWVSALELATVDYDQIVPCKGESLQACLGDWYHIDMQRFLLNRADLLVVAFWHREE